MNKADFNKFFREIKTSAISKGLDFQSFQLQSSLPFQIITHIPKKIENSLLIVAGIHWNESSPVYAMQEFISEYDFSELKSTRLVIIPCMNPYGFISNQRKNNSGIDLNRLFKTRKPEEEQNIFFQKVYKTKFQWFLTLHEDSSTNKAYFYCYNKKKDHIYRKVQQEVWKKMTFNTKNKIDWNKAVNGIIFWHNDKSLEKFMYDSGVEVVVCSETWMREDLNTRIKANKQIIYTFIESLRK